MRVHGEKKNKKKKKINRRQEIFTFKGNLGQDRQGVRK